MSSLRTEMWNAAVSSILTLFPKMTDAKSKTDDNKQNKRLIWKEQHTKRSGGLQFNSIQEGELGSGNAAQ